MLINACHFFWKKHPQVVKTQICQTTRPSKQTFVVLQEFSEVFSLSLDLRICFRLFDENACGKDIGSFFSKRILVFWGKKRNALVSLFIRLFFSLSVEHEMVKTDIFTLWTFQIFNFPSCGWWFTFCVFLFFPTPSLCGQMLLRAE